MMSAPIPSARVRQSVSAPDVRPTINRMRTPAGESATTLSAERNGRTPEIAPQQMPDHKSFVWFFFHPADSAR